ncbi:MAG: hypothetical protein HRF44_12420 [Ignavibacterium sp.]
MRTFIALFFILVAAGCTPMELKPMFRTVIDLSHAFASTTISWPTEKGSYEWRCQFKASVLVLF